MASDSQPVLRKHRLKHIPDLVVNRSLFTAQFAAGCSMANCDASCCRYGVLIDPHERDRILEHAGLIQRFMEPHQTKDPSRWFDQEESPDPDFPSGRAVGTQATETGCVFLDSAGRCTIQKASMGEGMHPFALKPFFCVAFPIAIDHGELTVDEAEFADRPRCCRPSQGGTLDLLTVCSEELNHVLGEEGFAELRALLDQNGNPPKRQEP